MKKTGKTLTWIISIFFILVLGAGIFLYMNFGDLAKRAAERAGTQATGTTTNLGSLDISLEQKTAVANTLSFANLSGFKGGDIISAEKITVTLESATRELVILKKVQVDGITVKLNQLGDKNNIIALRDQIKAMQGDKPANPNPVKVIVRDLQISESTLDPYVEGLPEQLSPIKVPPVRLRGVGAREGGVLAKEAVAQVLEKYLMQAQSSAIQGGLIEGSLIKKMDDALGDTKDRLKGVFGR